MTICVQCNQCQSKFKTDACHAGKTTRCPHCQQPLRVPPSNQTVQATNSDAFGPPGQDPIHGTTVQRNLSAEADQATQNSKPNKKSISEQLLEGFSEPIQRTRPTIRYLLSTVVVAMVMVLLPLVYIALIVLAGYGIYFHATYHFEMLNIYQRFPGYHIMVFYYSLPIVCGIILILFMFKPLLIKQTEETRTRSIKRDKEPLLFDFIDRICRSIRAPLPTRIDLDCNLNASASYGSGLKSLLSNHLVLTIGLPLVAGLNTRQFAGVLAHEFGHFAQGTGMRLTYLIRSISHWLLRVVYERDAIDIWLVEITEALNPFIIWIPYLARWFISFTRKILWCLMMLGHFVSSYLLRQMEFDADRYEARLAGSETFMQNAIGLQILGVATENVYADLEQNIRDGQLVDDLPELILQTSEQLPETVQEAVLSSIENTPTHWFDTHPADRDRIANALREDTEGVFQVEMPSTVLFNNFALQSKATTWECYREQFGESIKRSQLVPIDTILAKQELENVSQISLNRFFQGNWTVNLPFALRYKHSQPAKNVQASLKELKTTRQQMLTEMAIAAPTFQSLRQSQAQLAMAIKLRYCARAGLEVEIDGLLNSRNGEQEADQIESIANKNIIAASRTLEKYQDFATKRLGSALQLLQTPQVAKRIPNSDKAQQSCQQILQCYTALSDQMPTLMRIIHLHGVLGLLIERLPHDDGADSFYVAIQGITRQVAPAIRILRNSWVRCPYPYGSPDLQQSLGKYLIPELPISDQASSIFNGCDQAVTTALPLYIRLLGDLTRYAEAVETSLDLPPLPEVATQEA